MASVNTISLYAVLKPKLNDVLKPKLNDVFKENKRSHRSQPSRLRSHRRRETAIRHGNF